MSKYIIEIEDNAVGGLFKAKGFAIAFDKDGLDKLQKYEEPAEEVKEEQPWPQIGDVYFSVSNGGYVNSSRYDDDIVDANKIKIGNIFRTKKEAEFSIERLKVLAEMRKFAEPFNSNKWDGNTLHYYIYYNIANGRIEVYCNSLMYCRRCYFESEEKARKCIKSVGEDRIKKYYLGVE